MKVVIAAAGTGGHINPGLAIANEIMKNEPDSKVIFIGTPRGLENDLVPKAGYDLRTIDAYGFSRKLSISNLVKMHKNYKAVRDAYKILKEFRPDLVIGTGGYICIPVCAEAYRLKIPIIMHESNAYPGVSTKMISKVAEAVFVGFEDAVKRLPKAKKVVVTGNPSKIEKVEYSDEEKENKLKRNSLKDAKLPTVLIFGGSQGAESINNAIIDIIKKKLNNNYQIIWSVGKKNYEGIKNKLQSDGINIEKVENIVIYPYIYDMQEVMNIVDLVVCRSGAMTITEVAILEKPAIFIPYPFATENHQEYNARVLENVNAARIILDKELNAENLNQEITKIVQDKRLMLQMGKNASKVAKEHVETIIYSEMKKVLKKN